MNGLNVNWKIVDINDQLKVQDLNPLHLIDIGGYGLHVMHGAYGSTEKVKEWPVDTFLKVNHSLFTMSLAC